MEILPPLVIKLNPPLDDSTRGAAAGPGGPPGDGWQELLWHQSWDSYGPLDGEGEGEQRQPPPEWQIRDPAGGDAEGSESSHPVEPKAVGQHKLDGQDTLGGQHKPVSQPMDIISEAPSPQVHVGKAAQPAAVQKRVKGGSKKGYRAIVGALPPPTQAVSPITSAAAKQLKLALPPSEEADGEQAGYWTQRLQQLGA